MALSLFALRSAATALLLPTLALCATIARAGAPAVEIQPGAGGVCRLSFDSRPLPLAGKGGGFALKDVAAGKTLELRDGRIEVQPDGARSFRVQADGLSLQAFFTPQHDGTVRVRGTLTSCSAADRAIIVRYVLPLAADGSLFEHELSGSLRLAAGKHAQGTVFPVAAMAVREQSAALAIPPFAPCCFAMTGSLEGLGVEFYLGLTPDTKRFPNQAAFQFLIFAADPAAPFRSALARYYALFSDYYQVRFSGGGLWNRQEKGDLAEALRLYRYEDLTSPKQIAAMRRNREQGILSFGYILVGQREVKPLAELPEGYEGAMRVYEQFARRARESGKQPGRRSGDALLADLIEGCACTRADGRYVLQARDYLGQKAATFTMNPNPELFSDRHRDTVGGTALEKCAARLDRDSLDGIDIDSLGSQWPSTLNFRRDHFPDARYGATFDEHGRVALHNCLSHYEFVEAVRKLVRARGKLLFANGIDTYQRVPGTEPYEHFNSQDNGRFFLAALLDTAGRENTRLLERQRLERYRATMGRKLFTLLLYEWKDPEVVRVQVNRALAYAIFAVPNDLKNVGYVQNPGGFRRDRELLEWYVRLARLLHDAGWEPVTHARVDSADVACERFGSGPTTYFTLLNFGRKTTRCELAIDREALGRSSRLEGSPEVREIARNATLDCRADSAVCRVRVRLEPDQTLVLACGAGPTSSGPPTEAAPQKRAD